MLQGFYVCTLQVLSQRDKDDAVGVTRAGFLEAILRISFKLSTVLGSVSPDPLRGIEEIILRAKQLASQTARVGGEEYRAVAIYAQETDKVIRVNRKLLEELYSTYASMKRNEEGVSSPNNCHAESSKFLLQEYAALMCLEEWQLFLTHFNVVSSGCRQKQPSNGHSDFPLTDQRFLQTSNVEFLSGTISNTIRRIRVYLRSLSHRNWILGGKGMLILVQWFISVIHGCSRRCGTLVALCGRRGAVC